MFVYIFFIFSVAIPCRSGGQSESSQNALLAKSPSGFLPQTVSRILRDKSCFTQGTAISQGVLIESCGLYGVSRVLAYNLTQIIDNRFPPPFASFYLQPYEFAEGVAIDGDTVVLLTWKNRKLYRLGFPYLEYQTSFSYPRDGWGIAYAASPGIFFASDGSNKIYTIQVSKYDVQTLDATSVHLNNQPLYNLNELELVGSSLLANVWYSPHIVEIKLDSGEAEILYDLSEFSELQDGVANGVAFFDGASKDTVMITGKNWQYSYIIRLPFNRPTNVTHTAPHIL